MSEWEGNDDLRIRRKLSRRKLFEGLSSKSVDKKFLRQYDLERLLEKQEYAKMITDLIILLEKYDQSNLKQLTMLVKTLLQKDTELHVRLLELENISPDMYELTIDKISYMLISKSLSELDQ